MPNDAPWPIATTPLGPVAAGTLLWQKSGQLRLSVIVKTTFAFAPGKAMPLVDPTPIRRSEVHHGHSPLRSIREPEELIPFAESTDVLFVGHAYPPGGTPATGATVRLSLMRSGWMLLDKMLEVYGERSSASPEPQPFTRMPLDYEHAIGGIGSPENPLGRALAATDNPRAALANVFYPDAARRSAPASFAPVSKHWLSRKRLLRPAARKQLEQPIAVIPDDFDPAFFQAAPEDQRVAFLRGDEMILLGNLHPSHPVLELHLPGARAVARVYGPKGEQIPITLKAESLFIDGDSEQCTLTWRGSHPIGGESALQGMQVMAGVELPGTKMAWPEVQQQKAASSGTSRHVPPAQAPLAEEAEDNPLAGTMVLTESQQKAAHSLKAPFAIASPARAKTEQLPALWNIPVNTSEPQAAADHPFAGTMTLSQDEAEAPKPLVAPFAIAQPKAGGSEQKSPIPGAPWAPPAAKQAAPANFAIEDHRTIDIELPDDPGEALATIDLELPDEEEPLPEETAQAAPVVQEIVAPPPSRPAPTPPASTPKAANPAPGPSWSWATTAEAPSSTRVPAPPPSRPAPIPKPPVRSSLYGKFGPKKK